MPLIKSDYNAPFHLRNGHVQSIYPTLFRTPVAVNYQRERLELADGDFLDLDWSKVASKRLVILSHGLEGNSDRTYITAMVNRLNKENWDCLAWNFRGCSGEMNRLFRLYHNGDISDLNSVVTHAIKDYEQIALIGFSMGGNLTLNYLSRQSDLSRKLIASIVFSVPCDLAGSCDALAKWTSKIYMNRFLAMLKLKIIAKSDQFPNRINTNAYNKIKNFADFDNRYTAPLHGFENAKDYWQKASSISHLKKIEIPTLIVNAADDPFLSDSCYPFEAAKSNPNLFLEIPDYGGHVGFIEFKQKPYYWSEDRAIKFLTEVHLINIIFLDSRNDLPIN